MSKTRKIVLAFLASALLMSAAALGLGWSWVVEPHGAANRPVVIEIPPGYSSMEIVDMLAENDLLAHPSIALAYLYFSDDRGRLQAGEYVFDEPLNVPGVFEKLASGDVRLYSLTIPEGLRVEEVAHRWEESGFGTREDFLDAAASRLPMIRELDPEAVSVEGYLFPETYLFPRAVTALEAVDAMILGFRDAVERLEAAWPRERWPLDLHEALVLASMIEREAGVADERAVISSVFHNRLDRGITLDCDPTVIYALIQDGSYRGRLLRVDLTFDSPYNTYLYAGLPPGPIANPGFASLMAAIHPDETDYLFFVRTEGGRHTFSRTLAEHNRAVAAYRAMQ